jgi:hypothetical protein
MVANSGDIKHIYPSSCPFEGNKNHINRLSGQADEETANLDVCSCRLLQFECSSASNLE